MKWQSLFLEILKKKKKIKKIKKYCIMSSAEIFTRHEERKNQFFVTYMYLIIMKTCLYNFDPLKPLFYIVKLGFTGVYIIFLISAQKHRVRVLVRTEAVLTNTHNLCFEQKYEKYQIFLSENFQFLEVKFSTYLNRHVFVIMMTIKTGFN